MSTETADSPARPAPPSAAPATDNAPAAAAPPPARRVLRLNTMVNCRRSLARVVRELYADPGADVVRIKAVIAGLSQLLAYDKAIAEDELSARLDAIEARLAERDGRTAALIGAAPD